MIDLFPPDQESIMIVQAFREGWGYDDIECLMQVYCFQEANALQRTDSLALIDPFLAYLTADPDLHPQIRGYFRSEEERTVPCICNGESIPLWREVEKQEARVIVINLLTGNLFAQSIRENISEDVIRLAEAFLNLFAPDGQVLASFFTEPEIRKRGGLAAFNRGGSISDAVFNHSLTYADIQGCLIGISRKNRRMGIVLANDWCG